MTGQPDFGITDANWSTSATISDIKNTYNYLRVEGSQTEPLQLYSVSDTNTITQGAIEDFTFVDNANTQADYSFDDDKFTKAQKNYIRAKLQLNRSQKNISPNRVKNARSKAKAARKAKKKNRR